MLCKFEACAHVEPATVQMRMMLQLARIECTSVYCTHIFGAVNSFLDSFNAKIALVNVREFVCNGKAKHSA